MARRFAEVYINNHKVRTYGGNGSDVQYLRNKYLNMTKEEFVVHHPKWADEVKSNGYRLEVICPLWPVLSKAEYKNKYWK